ncbi:MAG: LysR family transcriptional regulator, partial [Verrucomicrobia subdivision 3 bacterium]|nr:LysR family transcriptional regulator [Limisphaerales bacterium]
MYDLLMLYMHEWLATVPFDLYELSLFQLVAQERSFTGAARKAGLTQSAMTRQVAGIERALGVSLFERTTRTVTLTDAGNRLLARAAGILRQVAVVAEELRHETAFGPKQVRVGVSRSIGFSYLPGFIFRFQRDCPNAQITLIQESSARLLQMVHERALDVAIVCSGTKPPRALEVAHHFSDAFTLIVPGRESTLSRATRVRPKALPKLLPDQKWLMIRRESATGRQLYRWLDRQGAGIEPALEVDN